MATLGRTPSPLTPTAPTLSRSPSNGQKQPPTPNGTSTLSRAEAIGRYRSGMLDAVPLAPTGTTTATTRRPRAGTMPSTFTLGAAPSGSSTPSELMLAPTAQDLLKPMSHLNVGGGSLSVPGSGGNTPVTDVGGQIGSYFGAPKLSVSATDLASLKARARAGTVAIPYSAAASSFGRGLFGSNFTPRTNTKMNEEIRSVKSDDDDDRNHINTLDYLGLDTDSPISPPSVHATLPAHPASAQSISFQSIHSMRQADVANLSAMAGRMRASTFSGLPPRLPPLIRRTSPIPDQSGQQHDGSNLQNVNDAMHMATLRGRLSGAIKSADPTAPEGHWFYSSAPSPVRTPTMEQSPERHMNQTLLQHAGTSPSNRPRATTLAAASLLGGPLTAGTLGAAAAARARAGTLASMNHPALLGLNGGMNGSLASPYVPESSLNASALGFIPTGADTWQSASRPLTPDGTQQHPLSPPSAQQPSRSLWIGNLDSKTSAQDLMTVFSAYGAIQSLRLLPEKECGFVNFMSLHDAVLAKDDVLNRLGGQIPLRSGPVQVRIGYGNPDSAPPTPSGLAGSNVPMTPSASMEPSLQSSPTRALWVGSIPAQTTPAHLMDIFAPYGAVESARVLTHKNCGFINFEVIDDAVRARKALNGREILGSDIGAIKIGYAKVPFKATGTFTPGTYDASLNGTPGSQSAAYDSFGRMRGAAAMPLDQQYFGGSIQDYRSNLPMGFMPNGAHAFDGIDPAQAPHLASNITPLMDGHEMQTLLQVLCGPDGSTQAEEEALSEFRPPATYYSTIPAPINAEDPHRRFAMSEAPRLRDIRKRIDSGTLTQEELDQIANELLEEIVYLSSDYIGNTIVQKLFERCSLHVKFSMLERIAPHLAVIGCHKNGTWAAQKIIDCARTPDEIALISHSLRPFTPPLLLDPLGNYVVQGVLRFGSPANDFAFDAMVDRPHEIAQGRFGARSVRTCLESPHTTPLQIKKVAISIILNSVSLATNPNGALLLTWLLDTSNLPGRYRLLAPRLALHLPHLCTHKLASLTVLRIINQKQDLEAAKSIVDALFHSPRQVLEEILSDQVHGVSVVQKILSSSAIDLNERPVLQEKARDVLLSLRLQHVPAYRKLAEDLGIAGSATSGNVTRTPPRVANPLGTNNPWPSPSGLSQNLASGASNVARPSSTGPTIGSPGIPQGNGMTMPMHHLPPMPAGMSFPAPSQLTSPGTHHVLASPMASNGATAGVGATPMMFPPQVGSTTDPFNALRYPQPFSFTPNSIGSTTMNQQQVGGGVAGSSVGDGNSVTPPSALTSNGGMYGTKGMYDGVQQLPLSATFQ